MKFLLALSLLATTAAFANGEKQIIKCYEPSQQGGAQVVAFVLEASQRRISVTSPEEFRGELKNTENDCLTTRHNEYPSIDGDYRSITFCPTDGQRIRTRVPVNYEVHGRNGGEGTVYCDKIIMPWF